MMTTKKMAVIIALGLFCSSTMLNGYKKKGDRSYRFKSVTAYNSTVSLTAVKPRKDLIDHICELTTSCVYTRNKHSWKFKKLIKQPKTKPNK
jgi:hypothetical protein